MKIKRQNMRKKKKKKRHLAKKRELP